MYKENKEFSGNYTADEDSGYDREDTYVNPEDNKKFWGTRAGGILLVAKDTKHVLLLLRSQDVYEPGTWGMPGGKVDGDESTETAVRREVREEMNYTKKFSMIPSYTFSSGEFKYYNFLGVVSKEFAPRLDWENDDFGWFNLENLPSPLHFGVVALLKNSFSEIKDLVTV